MHLGDKLEFIKLIGEYKQIGDVYIIDQMCKSGGETASDRDAYSQNVFIYLPLFLSWL